MTVDRDVLFGWIDNALDIAAFRDYSPKGLQIEGAARIERVALGVSAHLGIIEAAAEWGADALLVHHGFFWKGEPLTLLGWRKARIKALLLADINLGGYHLPLDAHVDLGNNARIADLLGLPKGNRTWFGGDSPPIACLGRYEKPRPWADVKALILNAFGERTICFESSKPLVSSIGICSGGAAGYFGDARAAGADVFITGEAREPTMAEARETDTTFVAAGHYRTERLGIQALGDAIADQFEVEVRFFEFDNPV